MQSVSSKANDAAEFANGQINTFLQNVEDLTTALKDVDTPEISRVKAKVKIALAAAKSAVNCVDTPRRWASAPTATCAITRGRSSALRR